MASGPFDEANRYIIDLVPYIEHGLGYTISEVCYHRSVISYRLTDLRLTATAW